MPPSIDTLFEAAAGGVTGGVTNVAAAAERCVHVPEDSRERVTLSHFEAVSAIRICTYHVERADSTGPPQPKPHTATGTVQILTAAPERTDSSRGLSGQAKVSSMSWAMVRTPSATCARGQQRYV